MDLENACDIIQVPCSMPVEKNNKFLCTYMKFE